MVEKKITEQSKRSRYDIIYKKRDVRYKPRMTRMIRIIKTHYLKFVQLGKFVVEI